MKVERDVDSATALRIVAILLGGPDASTSDPAQRASERPNAKRTLSELFASAEPKRNPDRIATAALYLADTGEEPFTRERIRATLRDARQRSFGNFSRDFDWSIRNGWLDGTDRDGYVLTHPGRQAVEAHFEKAVRAKTKLVKSGRARRKKGGAA